MLQTQAIEQRFTISRAIVWLWPVLAFTGLTAIGAQIRVPLPMTPIPVTLQTLFVILSGAWIGGLRGSLSQVLYLLIGVLGLPIFSGGHSGMSTLMGSTGGYLVGFMLAPLGVSFFQKFARSFFKTAAGLWLGGSLVIFGCGLMNLTFIQGLTIQKALALGFYPFIIGDFLKIGLAASLLKIKKTYYPTSSS